ncbi:orotidine-5'-phosphate decarboxylase [Streptomyces sp. ICC4]|uniref:orotidine-5'-phosphate decarboxylase n=1 Tax=Streptomyces sp. ICC4 TaxID=2099584 RepID=UPI000DC77599|nr:orotidine-5'-phosphate decarboxylase [Streptomyces sp. ICC4]AWZ10482.1 orotidine-5'-phosphate decarboxylase [Streptomyces sp. ICC4]
MDTTADHRIIVALDFDGRAGAEALVGRLGDACGSYKVGLELLTAAGPELVRELVGRGHEVFLDLKLFEIPNSVAGAVRAAGALGASMVTVHSMGGTGIMAAAVEAARDFPGLRVLALTVVTSMTGSDLADIGIGADPDEQVLRLARLAAEAGCDGVIASPREAGPLRALLGHGPLIVTPGVTLPDVTLPGGTPPDGVPAGGGPPGGGLAGGEAGGHARVGSARAAFGAGASHIVVGRSVTRALDPLDALRRISADLDRRHTP